MPLHAHIKINEKTIQIVTIGRTDKFRGPDFYHNYTVFTTREDGIEESATFNHLYRDGAEECLRRGLEALSNKRNNEGSRR